MKFSKSKWLGSLFAAVFMTLAIHAPALGDSVYNQMPYSTAWDDVPFYAMSDGQPGQYWDRRQADDFTLTSATSITGVNWAGSSENFQFSDLSNFSDWNIKIYQNTGSNLPGAEVFSMTFSKPATNPVNTGDTVQLSNGQIFLQSVDFAPVELAAGSYWISIGSINVSTGDDAWVWARSAAPVNDYRAVSTPYGSPWQQMQYADADRAFEIEGTAVPVPSALALLGIAGLVGGRRRRR